VELEWLPVALFHATDPAKGPSVKPTMALLVGLPGFPTLSGR